MEQKIEVSEVERNISASEIEKFEKMAAEWWDPKGKFKPLHLMNPTRISLIKHEICKFFSLEENFTNPLSGLKILDVGCGGGLITIPLARLGASVIGIDASEKNIKVANSHLNSLNEDLDVEYYNITIEELAEMKESYFDVVLGLEVIEHVNEPNMFVESLSKLGKDSSLIAVSTINKTIKSYLGAIVAAEYILKWLPKNTHEWSKFITPSKLVKILRSCRLEIIAAKGLNYNIINNSWKISDNLDVNYIIFAKK